jgi:hypothetical protein
MAEVEGQQITLGEVQDFILALPLQVAQQNFEILYPRVVEQLIYRTAMTNGEVAPVPVRARFGWIVLRLEERRPGSRPPFAQVRESVLAELEQEQKR